jgi:asparagine synthase (glutamine-hydrolysing)
MYRECQDVLRARKVANICEQPHHVITTGEEFLSRFREYAERSIYLTDGCVDLSRSPDLYVSEKARSVAPIKIVGTYGSEIIRQAVMFKPVLPMAGLFRREFVTYVQQAWPVYSKLLREHPVTFAAFRQSPWQHFGVLALENTQLGVRSPYLDNDFVRTVFRAPRTECKSNGDSHSRRQINDVRLRLIRDGNPALARLLTDRGVGRGFSALILGMPTTMECRNGSLAQIICFQLFISSACSWAGTSCSISGYGTGTLCPLMFGRCCSMIGRCPDHILSGRAWKLW